MSATRRGETCHTAAWPCGCVFLAAWVGTTAERASFYQGAADAEESAGVPVTTAVTPAVPPMAAWAWAAGNPCAACPPRKKGRPKRTPKANGKS